MNAKTLANKLANINNQVKNFAIPFIFLPTLPNMMLLSDFDLPLSIKMMLNTIIIINVETRAAPIKYKKFIINTSFFVVDNEIINATQERDMIFV